MCTYDINLPHIKHVKYIYCILEDTFKQGIIQANITTLLH